MCGGGGSSDKYSKRMYEMEMERQARIRKAQKVINNIFANSGRDAMYAGVEKTALEYNRNRMDEEYKRAQAQLTASLARRGLLNSSAEVAERAKLEENYNKELANLQSYALNQSSNFRMADERLRQSLLGLASSGIDASAVAQNAYSALAANAEMMKNAGRDYQVNDLLSGLSMYLGTKLPDFVGSGGGKIVLTDKDKQPWEWGAVGGGSVSGYTTGIGD